MKGVHFAAIKICCISVLYYSYLTYLIFNIAVYCLTDDQNVVDSVPTSNANGTWKQGRQLLRQSVYLLCTDVV